MALGGLKDGAMSINGISGGAVNGYFYAAATPEKPEQDDEPSSTSSATSTRTDRERDKLRSAQSALETIKQYNKPSDRDAERKARAKQKIAALKARLQMLQMIRPVSTRALAQLARELKAAMKEFGGASGTDGSSTSTQGDGMVAEAGSQNTAGDLNGGNLTADASTVDGDGTSPDASPSAGESGAKSDAESKAGDAEAKDDGTKAAVYRRMAEQASSRSAEQARKGEQNRSDKEFLTDVRSLAARIKALAREAAKEGLRGRHDAEEAESAATDAAREAQSAGQELGAVSLSVMA
ncbi:hypothetical protein [Novosphingobium sp. BL-8A]|uniref:hypothetical protein n=1 Tax=Novosphingobium sp. BL-8A TaxID=3127639 RepID=UPI003756F9F8